MATPEFFNYMVNVEEMHFTHDEFKTIARLKLKNHLEKTRLELLLIYYAGIEGLALSCLDAENLINNCLTRGNELVIPLHPAMKDVIEKLLHLSSQGAGYCPLLTHELSEGTCDYPLLLTHERCEDKPCDCPLLLRADLFQYYAPKIAKLAGINKIEDFSHLMPENCSSTINEIDQPPIPYYQRIAKYHLLTIDAIRKSRIPNMRAAGIKEEEILLLTGSILKDPQQYDEVNPIINHLFETNPFFEIFTQYP